jgi:hypothetical protein
MQNKISDSTQALLDSVDNGMWRSQLPATIIDFGIVSEDHLEALVYGIATGQITAEQLDAALGNGPMLTELASRLVDPGDPSVHPYEGVRFITKWDVIHGRIPAPQKEIDRER